ncbi:class F sortase [Candidatus Saccharibacteria bacterium]|nr:class F sortase [Candidatus Saccharibacteria bacterium]
MPAAARKPTLDLRAAEDARQAARQRAQRAHAVDLRPQGMARAPGTATAASSLMPQPGILLPKPHLRLPKLSFSLPRFKLRLVRPKLAFHPLTLGILAGVVAIFGIALIVPHVGAKVAAVPSLAAPAALAAKATPTPKPVAAPANLATRAVDRLAIPELGINAPIVGLGLVNGALDTPKTLWQVGHYNASSAAGSLGTAILVGHSGAPGQRGVFEHLDKLQPGDTLSYTYSDGRKFTYQVLTSSAYPVNQTTADKLFHQTANPTLNLISCYGHWDTRARDYDQRWIVTAQLTSS